MDKLRRQYLREFLNNLRSLEPEKDSLRVRGRLTLANTLHREIDGRGLPIDIFGGLDSKFSISLERTEEDYPLIEHRKIYAIHLGGVRVSIEVDTTDWKLNGRIYHPSQEVNGGVETLVYNLQGGAKVQIMPLDYQIIKS